MEQFLNWNVPMWMFLALIAIDVIFYPMVCFWTGRRIREESELSVEKICFIQKTLLKEINFVNGRVDEAFTGKLGIIPSLSELAKMFSTLKDEVFQMKEILNSQSVENGQKIIEGLITQAVASRLNDNEAMHNKHLETFKVQAQRIMGLSDRINANDAECIHLDLLEKRDDVILSRIESLIRAEKSDRVSGFSKVFSKLQNVVDRLVGTEQLVRDVETKSETLVTQSQHQNIQRQLIDALIKWQNQSPFFPLRMRHGVKSSHKKVSHHASHKKTRK